jgi:hypothetical protein
VLLFSRLEYSPREGCGHSVWCFLAQVFFVFLSTFVSIRLASGFWWKVVWRTVRQDVVDSPRGTSCSRTVRGRGTDRPRVEVSTGWVVLLVFNGPSAVWRGPSARWSRTIRPRAADRPLGLLLNS